MNKIKKVLLNPKDLTICNKNTQFWIKKKFKIEEITPGDYRVIVKANNNPVLVVENMYEVLCRTHAEVTQHGVKTNVEISHRKVGLDKTRYCGKFCQ